LSEAEANARAIAALPELVEAANQVVMEWTDTKHSLDEVDFGDLVRALRSALLKAKGGEG
jgi:hypothetical protein